MLVKIKRFFIAKIYSSQRPDDPLEYTAEAPLYFT